MKVSEEFLKKAQYPDHWQIWLCKAICFFNWSIVNLQWCAQNINFWTENFISKVKRQAGRKRRQILSSVQSLSRVWLFATPWTAACRASLSITNSRSLLKLMSIESVMPLSHLILCCPLLLLPSIIPSIRYFPMSWFFASGGQSIGVSASASVLSMNIQDWFHLGWTGWISLQSKELSRVFSNTTVQKHQVFSAQFSSQSNSHIHAWLLDKP